LEVVLAYYLNAIRNMRVNESVRLSDLLMSLSL